MCVSLRWLGRIAERIGAQRRYRRAMAEFERMCPKAHPSSGFFIRTNSPSPRTAWALLLGFRSKQWS